MPLTLMDRSSKQKINKETQVLSDNLDEMDLIDIFRTFYPNAPVKNISMWILNNMFLNNQQVTEEIKREIKKLLETNGNEYTRTQNLWDAAKAVLSGKFIIAIQSYLKR